jgi:hypothetical protein
MRRAAIICLALVICARVAPGQEAQRPFDASGYPREVQQSLQNARDTCKDEGGDGVAFAPDTVKAVDLTGDGRVDYIVDFHDTACAGSQSVYCGTSGCNFDIIVALPGGRTRTVFSDRVRGYEILSGKGGASAIRFTLHGGYCGGHGNPSCYKTRRITPRPFEFKMPQ